MKTDPVVLRRVFFNIFSVILIWNEVGSFQRISTKCFLCLFILDKPSCLFWQLHHSLLCSAGCRCTYLFICTILLLSCPCSTYLRNVWIIMGWPLNPGKHYQASCLSLAQSDLMGWITSFISEKNNFSASHAHTHARLIWIHFARIREKPVAFDDTNISSNVSKRSAVIFSPYLWSDYKSTWPPESQLQLGHGLKWVCLECVSPHDLSRWSLSYILPFVSLVWSARCQVLLSTKVRGERRRGQACGPGAWEGLEFHESRKCSNWIPEFTDQSCRLTVRGLRCVCGSTWVWELWCD